MILMLAKSIGEKAFLEGIRIYLKRHQFASASSEDLWHAFEESNRTKISVSMTVRTRTQGYLVVKVSTPCFSRGSTQQNRPYQIQFSQERFFLAGNITPDEAKVIYPLRLSIRTKSSFVDYLFSTPTMPLPASDSALFKVNVDHRGFYRILYEKDHLLRLREAHSKGWLSVEDRVGILSDATALAKAGLQSVRDLLDLVHAMYSDTSYNVWVQILKSLNTLKSAWFFRDEEIVDGLDKLLQDFTRRKIGMGSVIENHSLSDDFKRLLLQASGKMRKTL